MSVLIRNMDMPKNCISCRLRHSNDCLAILCNGQEEDGVLEYNNYRPEWCPLFEIQEKTAKNKTVIFGKKWIIRTDYTRPYECSYCHYYANEKYNFCPNCGSLMSCIEGEDE